MPATATSRDFSALRKEATEFLGSDFVRRAHDERLMPDLAIAALPPIGAGVIAWFVVATDAHWALKLAASVVLGWIVTVMGLAAHDLYVHRRRFGATFSRVMGRLSFALVGSRFTGYAVAHIRHHARLNTDDDSERYKLSIDTRLRRILFCTLIGFKLAVTGKWAAGGGEEYFSPNAEDSKVAKDIQREGILGNAFLLAGFVLLAAAPEWGLFLFVVPILIVAPALNSIRIIIEHADTDDRNPYWLAVNYRTGIFSRVMFANGAGDCHLVHHLFPTVPFYNCPKVAERLRPWLESKGVRTRTSFWYMLKGWFVNGYPHRTMWPD